MPSECPSNKMPGPRMLIDEAVAAHKHRVCVQTDIDVCAEPKTDSSEMNPLFLNLE